MVCIAPAPRKAADKALKSWDISRVLWQPVMEEVKEGRMRIVTRAAMTLVTITAAGSLMAGCSFLQNVTGADSAPQDAARIGTPFLVKHAGTAAEVTLTKITYMDTRPDGATSTAGEYAVLNVKVVGQSASPFDVSPQYFFIQYTQRPDPYQPQDINRYHATSADLREFPHVLPITAVTENGEVSGTVPLEVGNKSLILICMTAGDGTPIAQWLTTSRLSAAAPGPRAGTGSLHPAGQEAAAAGKIPCRGDQL